MPPIRLPNLACIGLALAGLLLAGAPAALAQQTPTPGLDTPDQRARLAAARAEQAAWRARPQAHFEKPAQSLPLPCARALAAIKTAAGIFDFDDPATRRQLLRMARQQGDLKTVDQVMKYSEMELLVLQGTCRGDAPSGAFDAWLSYVLTTDLSTAVSSHRLVVRVRGEFDDGGQRPLKRHVSAERRTDRGTRWKDPAMAAQMAAMEAKQPGPPAVSHTFIARDGEYSAVVSSTSMGGEPPMEGLMMVREWDEGGDRHILMRVYDGEVLSSEMRLRNGVQHGRTRIFAQRKSIAGQSFDIPASETCHEDGELIKTLHCDLP